MTAMFVVLKEFLKIKGRKIHKINRRQTRNFKKCDKLYKQEEYIKQFLKKEKQILLYQIKRNFMHFPSKIQFITKAVFMLKFCSCLSFTETGKCSRYGTGRSTIYCIIALNNDKHSQGDDFLKFYR